MDALQELAVRTESVSVNCSFRCEKPVILHDSIAVTHLYRIAQEAVTNAIKHSQPRNIVIELILNTDQIELKVTDDGKGYRLENDTKGMGIKTMQYRASLIGGALTIAAKDSGGTVVSCKFFRAGVL
jgi:signal transduction histidine kinase